MKKYIFSSSAILFLLFFWGCEKDFDGMVDQETSSYLLNSVYSVTTFFYAQNDSLLPLKVNFADDNGVVSVFADVYDSENKKLNSSPVRLADNGHPGNRDSIANDNIYSGFFPLSRIYPIGTYTVRYFVTDNTETRQVATHSFIYDNGQSNFAPEIVNLIMPDEVQAGGTVDFYVDVTDGNGLSDIDFVYYEVYDPNGVKIVNSQNISQFPMFDDGQTGGDDTENDGRYTVQLTFPSSVQKGVYRFEFTARDRRSSLSNKVIHNLTVL